MKIRTLIITALTITILTACSENIGAPEPAAEQQEDPPEADGTLTAETDNPPEFTGTLIETDDYWIMLPEAWEYETATREEITANHEEVLSAIAEARTPPDTIAGELRAYYGTAAEAQFVIDKEFIPDLLDFPENISNEEILSIAADNMISEHNTPIYEKELCLIDGRDTLKITNLLTDMNYIFYMIINDEDAYLVRSGAYKDFDLAIIEEAIESIRFK
ncbi:MAG: hypothetical protein FWE74_03995 [Oscillospiraceae bacterium]|nr:hypothetical protein [Oscillospiraceae bacterium]